MRIAISGSHSLGKSTLVHDWLAANPKYIHEEERYRALREGRHATKPPKRKM